MFTVFLIGNIASGKSTAARYLESRGAQRLDLDQMAKDLYIPGSALVQQVGDEFGWDVLDENGGIRTAVLAKRAFANSESISRLNAIVHPAVLHQLSLRLLPANCCSTVVPQYELTVVEISAPMSCLDAFGLADDVIAITAPLDIRCARAVERGMDATDFACRAEIQPSEEELCKLATTVIDNTRADDSLFAALDAWLARRRLGHMTSGIVDA